jgi:hypothetical protein
MLSTMPEPGAEKQAIPSSSAERFPPVTEAMPWATSSIAPRASGVTSSRDRWTR